MVLRSLVLLLVAALGAVGAAASARKGNAARPAARPEATRLQAAVTTSCPLPAGIRSAFVRAARDTGLQLGLLVAVAETESGLRPDALSPAGALGLMQVLPSTAASLDLDGSETSSNVLAGARYLRLLLDRYQSTDVALAAYNAGPTAVDRAGGVAPSVATLTYVANVQALWRSLEGCS
jgi:soluble lytic murein transglycosylase-like protein